MQTPAEPAAFAALQERKIISVIRAPSPQFAEAAARAIAKGGVRILEITFTVPDAPGVIASLAGDPQLVVGAGTVLSADQARAALDAGARFIVAPNVSRPVAEAALGAGVMYCPGAYTTNEILLAREVGAHVVKVYPVGVAGGPQYIRVIRDPLPDVPMLAAGGTTLENVVPFLLAGCVGVGLGGSLCDPRLATTQQLEALTSRARAFVQRLGQAYASGMLAKAVP